MPSQRSPHEMVTGGYPTSRDLHPTSPQYEIGTVQMAWYISRQESTPRDVEARRLRRTGSRDFSILFIEHYRHLLADNQHDECAGQRGGPRFGIGH
jgi:hypothetical protein